MKFLFYSFLCFATILLISCSSKTVELGSVSPDGKHTIVLTGKKPNFADPWQVIFQKKGNEGPEAPMAEIYASELNNNNVTFQWVDNETVKIHFIQQNDTERIIIAHLSDTGLKVSE